MYIVNHFLDVELDIFGEKILIPDVINAPNTNSASSITAQANLCYATYGRTPNVVMVRCPSPAFVMSGGISAGGLLDEPYEKGEVKD